MNPDPAKKVNFQYNKELKYVIIDAHKSDFVPKYLEYLLEYLKIPKDTKVIFKKDSKE